MLFSIKIQFKIIQTNVQFFANLLHKEFVSQLSHEYPRLFIPSKSGDILCIILSFGLRQLSANSLQKFCNSPLFPNPQLWNLKLAISPFPDFLPFSVLNRFNARNSGTRNVLFPVSRFWTYFLGPPCTSSTNYKHKKLLFI